MTPAISLRLRWFRLDSFETGISGSRDRKSLSKSLIFGVIRDVDVDAGRYAAAGGALTRVDAAAARRVPGCLDVLVHADLAKLTATLALDDPRDVLVYAPGDAVFVGARVAICVGADDLAALAAARAVVATCAGTYEAAEALDAAALDAALRDSRKLDRLGLGAAAALEVRAPGILALPTRTTASPTASVSGVFRTPLQKHFHMETHAARCVYEEGGGLRLRSSTQDPTLTQKVVAALLGARAHAVVVESRRAGGGFGGKLTLHLPAACAAAVVCFSRGVPARYQADRRDDMAMTGGRESCAATYAAGYDPETGRLESYDVAFALTSGCASNDGAGDLGMAVAWSDNVYSSGAHHHAEGTATRSTAPRNSSMRSPGVRDRRPPSVFFFLLFFGGRRTRDRRSSRATASASSPWRASRTRRRSRSTSSRRPTSTRPATTFRTRRTRSGRRPSTTRSRGSTRRSNRSSSTGSPRARRSTRATRGGSAASTSCRPSSSWR